MSANEKNRQDQHPLLSPISSADDTGTDIPWELLTEKGLLDDRDDNSLHRSYRGLIPRSVWFNCLMMVPLIWILVESAPLVEAIGHHRISLLVVGTMLFSEIMSALQSVLAVRCVKSHRFRLALKHLGSANCQVRVSRMRMTTWFPAIGLMVLLRNQQSIALAMAAIISNNHRKFPVGDIVNVVSKSLNISLRIRLEGFEPGADFFAKALSDVRQTRDALDNLYGAAEYFHLERFVQYAVRSVVFAIFSLGLANDAHGSSLAVLFVSAALSCHSTKQLLSGLYQFATMTASIMSPVAPKGNPTMTATQQLDGGVLGQILKLGERTVEMTDRDLLQFINLKEEFMYRKFGATLIVPVDWTLLVTATTAGVASSASFMYNVLLALHVNMQDFSEVQNNATASLLQ